MSIQDDARPDDARPDDPLQAHLRGLRSPGRGAFMPFLVAGDPDLETSLALADALVAAGADVLEFGFPFSDPPADGPVIQAADQRALAAGVTPPAAFELIEAIHRRHGTPVVLLMYYNLILQYGVDAFYARAARAGVQGVLVADLPIDLADDAVSAARRHGVAPIFIASELTPTARLGAVAARGGGFVYTVARVGVTGEQGALAASLPATLRRLREALPLPLLAGFGLSTPAQVRQVIAAGADGAIVGSALVRLVERHRGDRGAMIDAMRATATAFARAAHGDDEEPTC